MDSNVVEFLRKKDFKFVEELGKGACGKTVLLYDDIISENFVCKKYSPAYPEHKELLFCNFIQEIKLLHLVYHPNIVRVFNYYIYPEHYSGFILMEYISGCNIEEHLINSPERINEIFLQTIEGFKYLESNNILHRDIRPMNIMVRDDGIVKIIDFGFGKQISFDSDFNKSISLNWWCTPPDEFRQHKYNFTTEVYFVGKLFERIITDNGIQEFKFNEMLRKMCEVNPNNRIQSFFEINKDIQNNKFIDIEFEYSEILSYREFSDNLLNIISKIDGGAKYFDDINRIHKQLEDLYNRCMLEECIPVPALVSNSFINGPYYSYNKTSFSVRVLRDFIDLLRNCSSEKRNIIMSNIHTKLDSLPRYNNTMEVDDDLPF